MDGEFVTLYVTAASAEEARAIGRALVERRLAACANLLPIESIYRWEGTIEEAHEVAILLKTRRDLTERAIAAVKELHSYSVPCVVAWPWVSAHEPYAEWVRKSTR